MFWVIKRKSVFWVLLSLLVLSCFVGIFFAVKKVSAIKYIYTIVIDAGHGGIDGGSVGVRGTVEKDINLQYAKTLEKMCGEFGFKVVMTRTGDGGLYSPFAVNKKKDDMKKRKEIIEKSSPDVVVSIHMNSTTYSSSRGAQVFYNSGNENSKNLAENIQKQFTDKLINPRKTAQSGDFFITSCTNFPSIIVECGFLSNTQEEQLLLSTDYKANVCYSILCGILAYLG